MIESNGKPYYGQTTITGLVSPHSGESPDFLVGSAAGLIVSERVKSMLELEEANTPNKDRYRMNSFQSNKYPDLKPAKSTLSQLFTNFE